MEHVIIMKKVICSVVKLDGDRAGTVGLIFLFRLFVTILIVTMVVHDKVAVVHDIDVEKGKHERYYNYREHVQGELV